MKMVRLVLFTMMMLGAASAGAAIQGQEIRYNSDGVTLVGYLAWDDAISGKRPGVLVVHEWWGHNDYARKRARMLAEMGYVALALDMYGDGKTADHPKDAGKFSSAVMKHLDVARNRFTAAMQLLQQQAQTDASHIAAIGYCFGGGVVLQMARMGLALDAVASFHGSLATTAPAEKGAVKARIAVYNGADDPFVKPESIKAFRQEMDAAGADYQFENFAGAKHSFTNPDADQYGKRFDLPIAYNEAADRSSWSMLGKFLEASFSTAK